ncbi:MAG: sulfotransferase [bacterium]
MAKPTVSQRLNQARTKQRQGAVAEARALYNAILRDFPDNQPARQALGALPRRAAPPGATVRALINLHASGQHARLALEVEALLRQYPDEALLWNLYGSTQRSLGRMAAALRSFQTAATLAPEAADAPYNLGVTLQLLGQLPQAEAAYRDALLRQPGHVQAQSNLAVVLHASGRYAEAVTAHRAVLSQHPDLAEAHYNLGLSLKELGQPDEAIAANRAALQHDPGHAHAANNLGLLLQDQGDLPAAAAAFDRALALNPDYYDAFLNLTTLTPPDPDSARVQHMQSRYASDALRDVDRWRLAFALARIYDRQGNLARAFACLSEGNTLRKRQLGYDIAEDRSRFGALRAAAPALHRAALTAGPIATTPIFIVGMPRSGTTLVEQIVSAHPEVAGAGELAYVHRLGAALALGETPATPETLKGFRDAYLSRLTEHSGGKAYTTDKMPNNVLYLGLILNALPEAKVLHAIRDPAATCWSNFQQNFTANQIGYAFDLHDLVARYQLYHSLSQHWTSLYPGRILTVDYDALTADQIAQTRQLIASLGLPWDDACLKPEANTRAVNTASNLQIRKPVYQGSSQAWRRYEAFLDGAFDALPAKP